jgi:hypothetical protein
VRRHPSWCARDHTCSAGRMPDGQHRMTPETWQGARGIRVVWTRFQYARDGANGLEVRIVIGLPDDEPSALAVARHVAGALLNTLNTAGATPARRRLIR